jgi:hypothetical protein
MSKNVSFEWNETIQSMIMEQQTIQDNNTPTLELEFSLQAPRLEEQLHGQGMRLDLRPYLRQNLQEMVDSYIYLTSNEFMNVIGDNRVIFERMKTLIASYCVPLNGNSPETDQEVADAIKLAERVANGQERTYSFEESMEDLGLSNNMSETFELSPTCRFVRYSYPEERPELTLEYVEHSQDHWHSDNETVIDLDAEQTRDLSIWLERTANPVDEATCESIHRVTKFLEEYGKMRNMDPETIHRLNTGDDERSAELTVSDLKNILTYIQ